MKWIQKMKMAYENIKKQMRTPKHEWWPLGYGAILLVLCETMKSWNNKGNLYIDKQISCDACAHAWKQYVFKETPWKYYTDHKCLNSKMERVGAMRSYSYVIVFRKTFWSHQPSALSGHILMNYQKTAIMARGLTIGLSYLLIPSIWMYVHVILFHCV
mgnify:CR=1 FL=1